jgi:hypothetical protein
LRERERERERETEREKERETKRHRLRERERLISGLQKKHGESNKRVWDILISSISFAALYLNINNLIALSM